ncbi:MAG: hypothetical protein U1F66_02685 [bacterium]
MKSLKTLVFCLAIGMTVSGATALAQTGFSRLLPTWFTKSLSPEKPEVAPSTVEVSPALNSKSVTEVLAVNKCEEFKPYLEQSRAEMEKKNALEANACQLYKSWAKLWQESHCDANSYADAEALVCNEGYLLKADQMHVGAALLAVKTCGQIQQEYTTAMNWVQASFEACDYSMFAAGCDDLAESAALCESRACPGACTFRYPCSPESYKTLIRAIPNYFNNPARLDQCMENLRRSGI